MKINFHILADDLQSASATIYANSGIDYSISFVKSYEPKRELDESTAYIIDASRFTEDVAALPVRNWVCCGIPNADPLLITKANVLILPDETAQGRIAEKLGNLVLHYVSWSCDLAESALEGEEYKQILSRQAFKIVRNPFLLFNPSDLCVSAVGDLPDDFSDDEWREVASSIESDTRSLGFRMSAQMEARREPFILRTDGKYSLLVANIFVDDVRYGKIVFTDTNRPFTKGFISLAQYFSSFMGTLTQRAISAGKIGDAPDNFFVELLYRKHVDEVWFTRHLQTLGIRNGNLMQLLVTVPREDKPSSSSLKRVEAELRNRFASSATFLYQDSVVTILFGEGQLQVSKGISQALDRFPHPGFACCGISLSFYDLRQLRFYYQQALSALSTLKSDAALASDEGSGRRWYRFYDGSCFFHDFLHRYDIDVDSHWLIHPRVRRLHEYDLANESNNVECLKTYLEYGCSIKNAAEAMYMHYNTFLYRIERIKEVADIDLRNNDELHNGFFHILLSCKLLLDLPKM